MPARRVVVALGAIELFAWLLALVGVGGKVPPTPFVAADVAVEALFLVGLWFLLRVAWRVAVAGTVAGELLELLRVNAWSGRDAVLVAVGIVQLALLMLPQLRASLRPLPRGRVA
ncbi:MAG TPA: hypothetical protein VIM33_15130 [Gaiellaceae bacterium]